MAGMMMKVLCVMVASMVVAAPYAEALSCGDVMKNLAPCLNYLKSGGAVPAGCCSGVKSLNSAAKTTPDRKTACSCMKTAYKANTGIKTDFAAGLPDRCGVNLPYKISPSIDCNRVK